MDESGKDVSNFLEGDELAAFKRAHNIPENEDIDVYVAKTSDGKDVFVVVPSDMKGSLSQEEIDQYIKENVTAGDSNPIFQVNTTNGGNLNFRATPGLDGTIMDSIPKGTELEVLEVDDGSGWTKVRTADGREGYVYTSYLYDTGKTTDPVYTFSKEETDGSAEIQLSNGGVGYIASGEPQRKFNPSATVATEESNLNFRATPGLDGTIMDSISKGTELEVIEVVHFDDRDWAKVRTADGRIGYVAYEYLHQTEPVDTLNVPTDTATNDMANKEPAFELDTVSRYNGSQRETTVTVNSSNESINGYHYFKDEYSGKEYYYDNTGKDIKKDAYYMALAKANDDSFLAVDDPQPGGIVRCDINSDNEEINGYYYEADSIHGKTNYYNNNGGEITEDEFYAIISGIQQ